MTVIRFPQPADAIERCIKVAKAQGKTVIFSTITRPGRRPLGTGPDTDGPGPRAA
jgi:sugar/nucleoside kinase (ribokinase family)